MTAILPPGMNRHATIIRTPWRSRLRNAQELRLLQTEEDLRVALQRVAEFERARGRYERAIACPSAGLASP
jgi:hypothetical protein